MIKLNQARAMDRLGRVVLPIEVRNALNWHEETLLDIYYDTDAGEVRLKAHENTCVHCGSTQDLLKFQNRYICRVCQKKIAELWVCFVDESAGAANKQLLHFHFLICETP